MEQMLTSEKVSKKSACIVLPTYNEAENIPIIIPLIFEQGKKIDTHNLLVLVVDDNSPDGTQDWVKELQTKYTDLYMLTGEKQGLGEAYKKGFSYAIKTWEPDLIFEMDADLQHDPNLIPLFILLCHTYNFNVVIGSRFVSGGSTPNFNFNRKFLSIAGNWMIRFFGGLPQIQDCTSGYRCIKTNLIKKCDLSFLSTRGYSFQSSLLFELVRNGAQPVEIPIVFEDRIHGSSKLSFRDKVEFLINIPKIRFQKSAVFIKFCIVGLSGIFVNMGLFALLTRPAGIPLEIASPLAIEISILTNFFLNNRWTFKWRTPRTSYIQRLLKFHLVASVAAFVNYSVLLLLVKKYGVWDIGANFIGILMGTLFNYSMNSWWTWKNAKQEKIAESLEK